MSCPTGQIQVGVNPQTMQPICVDSSVMNGTGNSQTGQMRGSWWSQVLNTVPDILGGVADVISAKKGQSVPDTIVLQSTPPSADSKPKINWGWIILAVVVVAAVTLVLVLKKKK